MMKMDKNTEHENGASCDHKDDDCNIDPDITFSYIDKKIQQILGHFQKDFEGGISAENLGAKFGGYGSFLPTYERSPSIRCHPKTSQTPIVPYRNQITPRSPNSLPKEGASQNLTARPVGPPSVRLDSLHSTDGSAKQNACSSSAQVTSETSNKSGNPTGQRTLKVRIKVGSTDKLRKNTAIYSGLGLDNSPSSSLGSSPVASGGVSPVSRGTADESPTQILKVMTSFPVHGGLLISPLPDSLLCLARKEKPFGDYEPAPLFKANQRHSVMVADDSASTQADGIVKHGNSFNCKTDSKLPLEKMLENESSERNDLMSKYLKCSPLPNLITDDGDSVKVTSRACEVSCEAKKGGGRDKLLSTGLVKDELLESISGKDSGRRMMKNGSSNSCKTVLVDPGGDTRCKGGETFTPFKASCGVSKSKEDHTIKVIHPPKEKVTKEATLYDLDKIGIPRRKKVECTKKSEGIQICNNPGAVSKEESLKQRDIIKVGDSHKGIVGRTGLKQIDDRKDPLGRLSGDRQKVNLDDVKINRPKKVLADKLNNQLVAGSSVKDVQNTGPIMENGINSEMVPAATSQVVIQDNWVCCDICQKWRLLPFGTLPEDLPEKWLCSMLNWLPGMNQCDFSEEETTQALNALYQLPVSESQGDLHNHAKGTVLEVKLADDQNKLNPSAHSMPLKKRPTKEIPHANEKGGLIQISNSTKNHRQESVKSQSLNMNQPPAKTNLRKKYTVKQSRSLVVGEDTSKQKEKQTSGGVSMQIKMRRKMEADQYGNGTSKKIKTGGTCITEKYQNSDKLGYQAQVSFNDGSMNTISHKNNSSLKKRKLKDRQENTNHEEMFQSSGQDAKEESSESGFGKRKKLKVSNTINRDDAPNKTVKMTSILPSSSGDHLVGGMAEVRSTDKNQQLRKNRRKVASEQTLDGVGSSIRDFGHGQLSMAATSSSSMVSGPRKCRANLEEVKCSPVESVSSSPLRICSSDTITVGNNFENDDVIRCDLPVVNNLNKRWDGESNSGINGSGNTSKGKFSGKANPASRFGKSHLVSNGDAVEHCCQEDRVNNRSPDNVVPNKSGKGLSSLSKDKHSNSTSDVDRDKVKFAHPASNLEELCPNNSLRCESKIEVHHDDEMKTDVQNRVPAKYSSKSCKGEKNHVVPKDAVVHCVGDTKKKENRFKLKYPGGSDGKLAPRQNTGHDFEGGSRFPGYTADPAQVESTSGRSQILHCEGEGCQLVSRSEKGDMFGGISLGTSHADDVLKGLKQPVRRELSLESATNALKESKGLRDYADRLKSSGFVFESNEAYFQAALKFFHAASLLENCNSEIGIHGEMNQMQAYVTTAELCRNCAHEYETRQEMAAAALAYKCMEVAYMRMVYCKNSSTCRERCELQATLQMVPQGDSPSSSASDVDNLNNQATLEKTSLSKGATGSISVGNFIIVARNRTNFARLIDFTQNVNLAMEASRKSQIAFAAANTTREEAHNKECFISLKRVIDFSFQDVEEFIRLVRLAMETISC